MTSGGYPASCAQVLPIDLHPFIVGLLQKLPPPDAEWAYEQRAKWLTTASNIFDLMYAAPLDGDKSIAVTITGDKS